VVSIGGLLSDRVPQTLIAQRVRDVRATPRSGGVNHGAALVKPGCERGGQHIEMSRAGLPGAVTVDASRHHALAGSGARRAVIDASHAIGLTLVAIALAAVGAMLFERRDLG
jgi:hypothetical protein